MPFIAKACKSLPLRSWHWNRSAMNPCKQSKCKFLFKTHPFHTPSETSEGLDVVIRMFQPYQHDPSNSAWSVGKILVAFQPFLCGRIFLSSKEELKKFGPVLKRNPMEGPNQSHRHDAKWSGSLKSWNAWRKWFVGKLILSLPKTKIAPGCLPSQTGKISEDLPTNPFLQLPNVSGYPVILQPLRLDRGSASTVLQLHFLEDPPKVTKTAVTTKSSGGFSGLVCLSKKHRWSWAADGYRSFFALFGLSFWSYRTVSPKPCLVSQKTRWWSTIRPCCRCCYYWHRRLKSQVVTSKMQSVWMRSRSFFSCALKWATQRTRQHNGHAGLGGVGGGATVATILTIHTAPTPLPAQPLPSQFAEKTPLGWPTSQLLIFLLV